MVSKVHYECCFQLELAALANPSASKAGRAAPADGKKLLTDRHTDSSLLLGFNYLDSIVDEASTIQFQSHPITVNNLFFLIFFFAQNSLFNALKVKIINYF